jgi:hypothetical protein
LTSLTPGSNRSGPWIKDPAATVSRRRPAAGKRPAAGQVRRRRAAARWRDGEVELGCSNRDGDGTKTLSGERRAQRRPPEAARATRRGGRRGGAAADSGEPVTAEKGTGASSPLPSGARAETTAWRRASTSARVNGGGAEPSGGRLGFARQRRKAARLGLRARRACAKGARRRPL